MSGEAPVTQTHTRITGGLNVEMREVTHGKINTLRGDKLQGKDKHAASVFKFYSFEHALLGDKV